MAEGDNVVVMSGISTLNLDFFENLAEIMTSIATRIQNRHGEACDVIYTKLDLCNIFASQAIIIRLSLTNIHVDE